jgi:hypothetical protein
MPFDHEEFRDKSFDPYDPCRGEGEGVVGGSRRGQDRKRPFDQWTRWYTEPCEKCPVGEGWVVLYSS